MTDRTDAGRLAAANEILIGAAENGPWVGIPDRALRELVGRYIADTCHVVAVEAGLDEAVRECATLRRDGPLPVDPWPDASSGG